uniref:Coatomer WD associated region domain-containing protein n=1 Tax=Parascaris equorum TaxID=6256 RepID=A0A914RWT3_PAREQ
MKIVQLSKLASDSLASSKNNVAFLSYFLLGNVDKCLDVLISTDRIPEAAFFARTYCPSQNVGESLADPQNYENLFSGYTDSLKAEQFLRQLSLERMHLSDAPPSKEQKSALGAIANGVQLPPTTSEPEATILEESRGLSPKTRKRSVSPPDIRRSTSPTQRGADEHTDFTSEHIYSSQTSQMQVPHGPDVVQERARPDIVPASGGPDVVGHVGISQPQVVQDAEGGMHWSDDEQFTDDGDINIEDLNLDEDD